MLLIPKGDIIMTKTSMNLEENIASMLCYIGAWITGIIFIAMEKENKTVRFHAWQSFLTFLPLTIVAPIIGWIGAPKWTGGWYYGNFDPGITALIWLSWIIYLMIFVLWLIFIIMAVQNKKFKLPIIGNIAEKQAQK
jgi:uncharacterized membrane protein